MKKAIVSIVLVLSVVLFSNCIYAEEEGLVGYWKFDESKGEIAKDFSGNGNDGTICGAVATAGKIGQALSFDGKESCVSGLPAIKETSTISLWIKAAAGDWNAGPFNFARWSAGNNFFEFRIKVTIKEGNYSFWAFSYLDGVRKDFNVASSGTDYRDNAWHHVAITFQDAIGKAYVDGEYIGQDTCQFSAWDTAANSITGLGRARNYNYVEGKFYYFNGAIDEVRIYNRALTAIEIENHYKMGSQDFI